MSCLRAACLAAAVASACLAAPLRAQQPANLQGLVVSPPTGRPSPNGRRPRTRPSSMARSWNAPAIEYVADALRQVAGLDVARNGSFGAFTSLFLRGGESDYVQVLIDGVRVNQPGGAFDFAALTTDNVERIEIVRGPASALYGSDAVSGVIQIFTHRGSGRPRGSLSFQGGSFGTRRWQGGLSGGSQSLSYAFSLGRNETDGILEFNNDFRHTTATGRVQGLLDEDTDASVSVRYDDRRFHYPTDGSGNLVDENANSFGDALSVNIDAGRRWTDVFEARFGVNVHESDSGTDDAPDSPADTLGFHGFKSLADLRRTTLGGRAIWRPGEGTSIASFEAGIDLDATVRRTGERSARDFSAYPANPVTLPAYTLLNLAASFEVGADRSRPGFTLSLRLENLLDESYQEIWGFAAPGRAIYVGGSVAAGGGEG